MPVPLRKVEPSALAVLVMSDRAATIWLMHGCGLRIGEALAVNLNAGKSMALDDILTAIRVVTVGDAIIAPGVTRRLIAHFTSQPRPGRRPRELTGITDREREVLRLVGLGMSNAEIAAALYITAGTAKTHVARLLAKLDARDRV